MKHPQNQHKLEHLPPQDFVLHLTRIWLLDVLLQKVQESHEQTSPSLRPL